MVGTGVASSRGVGDGGGIGGEGTVGGFGGDGVGGGGIGRSGTGEGGGDGGLVWCSELLRGSGKLRCTGNGNGGKSYYSPTILVI